MELIMQMGGLWESFREGYAARLGFALLHFCWQGTAIAVVALLSSAAFHGANAKWRYAVHVGALLAMLSCLVAGCLLFEGPTLSSNGDATRDGAEIPVPLMGPSPSPSTFVNQRTLDTLDRPTGWPQYTVVSHVHG
jgi:hypothetical protein